jgi:hypothetical protein
MQMQKAARQVTDDELWPLGLDRRMAMAKVIEFYIPDRFKANAKWVPPERRGKVIEFPAAVRKSA